MMRLNHIGFVTNNIEEFLEVLRLLGLKEATRPFVNPLQGVAASFVKMYGDEEVYLEVLEPAGEGSPIAGFLSKRGGGIHHICFEVDDLDKTTAFLLENGFKMVVSPQDCEAYDINLDRRCETKSRIAFFMLPDRLLVEFIEKGR